MNYRIFSLCLSIFWLLSFSELVLSNGLMNLAELIPASVNPSKSVPLNSSKLQQVLSPSVPNIMRTLLKDSVNVQRSGPYQKASLQFISLVAPQSSYVIVTLIDRLDSGSELIKVPLGSGPIVRHYSMTSLDDSEQVTPASPQCPDNNTDFLIVMSYGNKFELSHEKAALTSIKDNLSTRGYHVKVLSDVKHEKEATLANFENNYVCPSLKGMFVGVHGSNDDIVLEDGNISASMLSSLRQFGYNVPVIFGACDVFTDPMKTSMMYTADAQKFSGGKQPLIISMLLPTYACFWKDVLAGESMSKSLEECKEQNDTLVPHSKAGLYVANALLYKKMTVHTSQRDIKFRGEAILKLAPDESIQSISMNTHVGHEQVCINQDQGFPAPGTSAGIMVGVSESIPGACIYKNFSHYYKTYDYGIGGKGSDYMSG